MKSSREFQTWAYRVSHGELLIRSPKGKETDKNIDLVFTGVEYLSLPRFFTGIEVVDPSKEERDRVARSLGTRHPTGRLYVLESQGLRHWVYASSFEVMETTCDIFETPFEGLRIAYGDGPGTMKSK